MKSSISFNTNSFEQIYTDLRQWCEDGTLYLRCVKEFSDEIKDEVTEYATDQEFQVYDVTNDNGEIEFWVDSEDLGYEFIVSYDSDNFEFFLKSEDEED